jgi:TrmH family RNA methyltransferase
MIESVNNEKIKNYAKLNDKKYRDNTGLFLVEGEHLVEEALKRNIVVEIFSLDNRDNSTQVSEPVMKKLSNLSSVPKVLAVCKKIENTDIKGNILMLDCIQDPGNLGTIIRSSVAFGIDTIVASKDTVDLYNIKVLRATEGMIFNINIIRRDLNEILPELKNKYTIYTTNVVNGTRLEDIKVNKPFALIMGSEGNGVKDSIASYADESVYINMNDKCESLNVGVATSIILYEFNK